MKSFASIKYLLTDIDDTLTTEGQLHPKPYEALWRLKETGIHVIPVTGRPAGWCEMIARFWPVSGVVGENGAFYFRYTNNKMKRHFLISSQMRKIYKKKLIEIKKEILSLVPQAAISSDQFCRLYDLAIDVCEDIPPLSKDEINQILKTFQKHKAHAKLSSIHINGWFGDYDKTTGALALLKNEFQVNNKDLQNQVAFIGDSPNDEPLWKYFNNSFAVANIASYLNQLQHPPQYIMKNKGGEGFTEAANLIINSKK